MSGDPKISTSHNRLVNFLLILFVLTIGIGIGTLITNRATATGPGDSQLKIQTDGKPLVGGPVLALSQAFEEVADHVEPAVVNINTEEIRKTRGGAESSQDEQDFLHRFFPNAPAPNVPDTIQSLGSGVIVDAKGYILTNNHVVSGASKIKVKLFTGEEYPAKVIGTDDLSDLAVIKIECPKQLPAAKLGDSKAMKVGDWVIAIGSPFGLSHTVTAGIISATGRVFSGDEAPMASMLFNDYLQTDAAINQGNSGGPLVNMNGEIVGINSFISTPSRASAGVGFAVPSHTIVNVYNQIIEKGRVARGWIGINMNYAVSGPQVPFTPEIARYFGVKQDGGVIITGLSDEKGNSSENGPAAKAGLKAEDVMVEFNGKKVYSVQDLRLAVANTPPGQTVPLRIVRFGQEKMLNVTVGERQLESQDQSKETFNFEEKPEPSKSEIGLTVDTLDPKAAQDLSLAGGAIVVTVKPGSLAEDAGIAQQDIIVAASGKKISTGQDFFNLVKGLRTGEAVVLKFLRVEPRSKTTQVLYTSIVKP
jgi:serine protease Do